MTLDVFTSFCLVIMGVILFFDLESTVKRIDRRTKRLDLCMNLILERLEIDTPFQLSERIQQIALDPKRKVEAVRLYKEETGASLKEAVDVINTFLDRNSRSH